jgi:hypothetical protein
MFKTPPRWVVLVSISLCLLFGSVHGASAQNSSEAINFGKWVSVSANLDGGYRSTQFFEPNYNTALLQVDSRCDLWLPPFRGKFAWGPYLRVAAITSSESQPWENAWLGRPGIGLQVYPFSFQRFEDPDSAIGKALGPVRIFAERNLQEYWGSENAWRPRRQVRAGLDYWKAVHVNERNEGWWAEIWNGAYWQSANEFDTSFDTFVFANSARSGVRASGNRWWSLLTPYAALESSLTRNHGYYSENRLLLGGGGRVTPSLPRDLQPLVSRFVLYAEVLRVTSYYHVAAPSEIPRHDVRVGLSASLGDWFK